MLIYYNKLRFFVGFCLVLPALMTFFNSLLSDKLGEYEKKSSRSGYNMSWRVADGNPEESWAGNVVSHPKAVQRPRNEEEIVEKAFGNLSARSLHSAASAPMRRIRPLAGRP